MTENRLHAARRIAAESQPARAQTPARRFAEPARPRLPFPYEATFPYIPLLTHTPGPCAARYVATPLYTQHSTSAALLVLDSGLAINSASERTRERASERTRERANARASERANERTSERANERTRERASARTSERANERARERANARTSERANERTISTQDPYLSLHTLIQQRSIDHCILIA